MTGPVAFYVLVFTLALPFWYLGAVRPLELLPGLPVSALQAICPSLAASLLVYRERGSPAVVALLRRAFDGKRIQPGGWYAVIVLLMPCLTALSYWLMRLMQVPMPAPRISLGAAAIMFVPFLGMGIGEELGWTGYALEPLQQRLGALGAGVVLGAVWAAWHVLPLTQAHRSGSWIAWWCLGTVGTRVLMVWIYDSAGKSVFAVALYHAIGNLCWQLFPNGGSHWDPRITSPLIVTAAVGATLGWSRRRVVPAMTRPG